VLQQALVKCVPGLEGKWRTIQIEIIHSSYIGLRLPSDETDTLFFATVAWLRVMTVVSSKLRTSIACKGGKPYP
jgi:hypothetical protein